jgi:hypothetical protein
VYSDYCYGFPPVLRDANGRNTKVRIEILEGTPKEVAIVELSRALMAIETDEDVVRWLTADDEAQEPADLSEDDEVSPGSAEDTELPY